jgi:predicted transcriptional regulator
VSAVQLSILDPVKPLSPTQREVFSALGWLVDPSDTSDIQHALAERDVHRQTNTIAKRLCELEAMGLVQRTGRNFERSGHPTTWRRT